METALSFQRPVRNRQQDVFDALKFHKDSHCGNSVRFYSETHRPPPVYDYNANEANPGFSREEEEYIGAPTYRFFAFLLYTEGMAGYPPVDTPNRQ